MSLYMYNYSDCEWSGGKVRDQLKLTKLTENEDIEAYMKTFKRTMEAYDTRYDATESSQGGELV